MNRFLITCEMSRIKGEIPLVKIFSVSSQVGAYDVTYPANTFMFFFMDTEMSKEELLTLMFTIQINNVSHVMLTDERFLSVKKFYVPEENMWSIKATTFGDNVVGIEELVEKGFYEIV